MGIQLAHVRINGQSCVIFDADSRSRTAHGRQELLGHLVRIARARRLRVDEAALAFVQGGRLQFFGTPSVIRYLSRAGVPAWTHTLQA